MQIIWSMQLNENMNLLDTGMRVIYSLKYFRLINKCVSATWSSTLEGGRVAPNK